MAPFPRIQLVIGAVVLCVATSIATMLLRPVAGQAAGAGHTFAVVPLCDLASVKTSFLSPQVIASGNDGYTIVAVLDGYPGLGTTQCPGKAALMQK